MAAGRFVARCGDVERNVESTTAGEVAVDGGRPLTVSSIAAGEYLVRRDGVQSRVFAAGPADAREVFVDGRVFRFDVVGANERRRGAGALHGDMLAAPMPGTVVKLLVTVGQQVKEGDLLLKLEAMKMELPIRAPHDGSVAAVHCQEGELVQAGMRLLDLTDTGDSRQ